MGPRRRPALRRWLTGRFTRLSSDPVVRFMLLALGVIQLIEVSTRGPALYPDTDTYRVHGTWLDVSLTSLGGRSVRPWGVTVWMALWPGDEGIVLAQTVLAVLAWGTLAVVVAGGLRRPLVRRIVVAVLLVISASAQVASWQLAILGESVSISSGILALALSIRMVRHPSWGRVVAFLLAALWFTMTRPNTFPVLLAWAVAALLFGFRRQQRAVGVTVACALVAFSLYSYVYNVRSNPAWAASPNFGVTRTTVAYGYPVSGNDPVGFQVLRDLRRSDAPKCMIPDIPEDVSADGTTAWVQQTAATCPGMQAWLNAHWNGWWLSWLATHPGATLHIIGTELPNSLSPPIWTGITSAVPLSVSTVFFGTSGLPQSAIPTDTFGTQPILIWLAVALGLAWLGRRRLRARASGTGLLLLATVAGGLLSAISSGLLIQTAPFEVGQESVGVTVLLTVATLILVGLLVDRLYAGSRTSVGADQRADSTAPNG
jgi:hypothetical protein